MKDNGLITKLTHEHTIRVILSLVINEEQLREAISTLAKIIKSFD